MSIYKICLFLSVCFLAGSLKTKADTPGNGYQYDLYAQNGAYYFKSVPYYDFADTDFGKTTVYKTASNEKLYTINNYLPMQSFLSNNGRVLVTTQYWLYGHSGFKDQPLVEFYIDGAKTVKFFLQDMLDSSAYFQPTSSHTLWQDDMFMNNDTIYILTLGDDVIMIDINKAEIIGKQKKDVLAKRFDLQKPPRLKRTIHYDIKYPGEYPGRWLVPDLVNGNSFKESLLKNFALQEVELYDSCTHYLQIYCAIDLAGNCEIFMISSGINRKEDAEWEKQVKEWVTLQKYKTELIPENCEKWVFKEYLYMKR